MKGLTYLAAPISHRSTLVRWRRMLAAAAYAASLMASGVPVFCPGAHSIGLLIAAQGSPRLGSSWRFWRALDLGILAGCGELRVLMLPGWRSSRGVKAEIAAARRLNIPVRFVTPKGK